MTEWSHDDPLLAAMRRKGGASEARQSREQDLRFRVEARRNRLLAEWVAARVGLPPDAVPRYVEEVIAADLSRPGADDLAAKILADLHKAAVDMSEADLRTRIAAFEEEAWRQIEGPGPQEASSGSACPGTPVQARDGDVPIFDRGRVRTPGCDPNQP